MKIVLLDVKTIGEDIDLSGYDALGEVVKYDFTSMQQVPERVKDADVIVLNKALINESTIGTAENLKLVCVTATGTNNLDKEYLEKRENLSHVFMLVDFRHKPTEDDVLMYNFLKYYNIPVTIVATKCDKVGSSKKEQAKKELLSTLDLVVGDNLVLFSSVTKLGRDEILEQISTSAEEII